MAQESECQIQAKPLAAVAIVGYSHGTSYVLTGAPGCNPSFGKKFPKNNCYKFGHF
jgi:hypothetical protein